MAQVARSLDSECAVLSLGPDRPTSLQSSAEGHWPPFREHTGGVFSKK